MRQKGKLITLSGIDGCGKSTVASNLCDLLRNSDFAGSVHVEWVKFGIHPFNGLTPHRWRTASETFYLKNDRTKFQVVAEAIYLKYIWISHILGIQLGVARHLARGDIVICDRYIYDTVVDLTVEFHRTYGEAKSIVSDRRVPVPNLALWIDVDPTVALARKENGLSLHHADQRRSAYSNVASDFGLIRVDGSLSTADTVELALRELQFVEQKEK